MNAKQNRFISLYATADEYNKITKIMEYHERPSISDAVRFLIAKENKLINKREQQKRTQNGETAK